MKTGNKYYKIIIDTNIWISFLIGKSLKGLQNYIDSSYLKIITCNEQIAELISVFKKPKIKKYFTNEQISGFLDLFEEFAEKIQIKSKTDICRDAKDNYLISLAIDSKADYLITGDNDLLSLEKINRTNIIKYTDFNNILRL